LKILILATEKNRPNSGGKHWKQELSGIRENLYSVKKYNPSFQRKIFSKLVKGFELQKEAMNFLHTSETRNS
jgi:hypothetical protein